MHKKILRRLGRARDRVGAFFYDLAASTLTCLPLGAVRTLSCVTFFFLYPLVGLLFGLRRRVAANIRIAYGDSLTRHQANGIARRVLFNQLIFMAELFHFSDPKTWEQFREMVTIEGLDILADVTRNGKGAIGVSAHLGSFQLMILRFALADVRFVSLIKRLESDILNDTWNHYMDLFGLKRIMMKNRVSAVKEIMRELKRSSFVMFIADEYTRRGGLSVNFFGQKTSMAAGPASLALRMKVPLLPTFILRERGGTYRIVIEPPIEFTPTGDFDADVVALTQKRIDVLEAAIRKNSDQWLWTQSRWKKRRYGKM
jgi:lauroyl/myristoyl acyltransferase